MPFDVMVVLLAAAAGAVWGCFFKDYLIKKKSDK